MKDESFKDYVLDLFTDFGDISIKSMFGGWGLYKDYIIFAIIIDGELYFKVDNSNRKDYEDYGSRSFEYTREGKQVALSYWLLPEEIMENKERLYDWAQVSIDLRQK